MRVRKSKGRRRGPQHGVQRNKILRRPLMREDWDDANDNNTAGLGLSMTRLLQSKELRRLASQWAQKCFDVTSSLCCTLCLAPLVKAGLGGFRAASFWPRVIHYVIMALLVVTCVHKLGMTVMAFTLIPFETMNAVLSYAGFHLQMTAMSVGMGFVLMPSLSCESLSSWIPTILQIVTRLGVAYRTPWTCASCSFQVLAVAATTAIAIAVFPSLSFIFPTAPIFVFPSL